jgi:ferredoxin
MLYAEDEMISLEDETCIDCGICADVLPQYFEVAEGKVRVRGGAGLEGDESDREALEGVIRDCPSGSIRA